MIADVRTEAIEPHITQLSTEFRPIAGYRSKKQPASQDPEEAQSLDEIYVINFDEEEPF
jgi:hypothetical protein